MKILQITSTPVFYPGGMERVIWEISKRLAKKHEVVILQTNLYDKKTKYEKIETKDDVKIITCKSFFLFGYGYSLEFKKALKRIWKDFDVVHIHGCGRFTTDFSLKFLKDKIPIVFTSHGFFHSKKAKIFKFFDRRILKKGFRNVRFANALTKAEFDEYNNFGISNERIVEIPNGIDLKKFKKDDGDVEDLRKKYGLGDKVVLYVGRIHESKGLGFLVRAVEDIDCQVLIVGRDGGYRKELESLAERLGIQDRIIFTGGVSEKDLISSYFASDVFVLPSQHEGFGIVVIEAMAAGLPVIVSDRGSLPYIVKDGVDGFVLKYGDVEELKKGMKKLLGDKDLGRKFGKEGGKSVKKYDWDRVVEKYERIYKKALVG